MRQHLALALLAFAHMIISLDYTIVFVALPEIGRDLGFSAQTVQWVVSGYVVPYGGLLLLGGRACDLLGRRRMFAVGMFLFAVASLAGGCATEPSMLIAARAVQGLGGALLFPATLSLINTMFAEGRERNLALSIWAGAGGSGMALGGLAGGALTQLFGWGAVFFVNVPLAGIGLILCFFVLQADGAREAGRRFDLPGAAVGTLGTLLLVFSLVQGPESGWTSKLIASTGTAAAVLLAMFVFIERLSRDPLVPLRLFVNRSLCTGLAIILLFTATFGSLLYFLTIYFQSVLKFDAMTAGLAYLVPYTIIFITSSIAGRFATRYGLRATLVASIGTGTVGLLLLGAAMSSQGTYLSLLPGLIFYSAGMGFTYPMMFAAATSGVEGREQGVASGIASTGQQLGNAIGLAILVAIANAGTQQLMGEALRVATADGLQKVTFIAAAGALVMLGIALSLRRESSSQREGLAASTAP